MSSISSRFYPDRTLKKASLLRGFGMIELMVTISIMLVISSIILVKQTSFNGATLLRSQVYEVALAVRELQLSVVSAESNGSGGFRSVQGVYFSTSNPSTYRVFKDAGSPGNMRYDATEEIGQQGFLDQRFEIREIRKVSGGVSTPIQSVSIVFQRPNFDSRFFDNTGELSVSRVEIDIARKGITGTTADVVRTLEITSTGQISVK